MLRVLPVALLATTLLWLFVAAPSLEFFDYILLPMALPFLAIALKRWIEFLRNPDPPLPRLADDGHSRNPLRYLQVAGTVVRVMLLFVLFGMFVGMQGTTIVYKGANVELAKTTSPDLKHNAMREDAILISVYRDGKVYLQQQDRGFEQVAPDRLPSLISQAIDHGSERRVYIKADAHVRYRMVKDVLDSVRSTRIENVTFLVEQVKPAGPVEEIRNVLRP